MLWSQKDLSLNFSAIFQLILLGTVVEDFTVNHRGPALIVLRVCVVLLTCCGEGLNFKISYLWWTKTFVKYIENVMAMSNWYKSFRFLILTFWLISLQTNSTCGPIFEKCWLGRFCFLPAMRILASSLTIWVYLPHL